jgi:hypothetical protein
MNPGEFITLAGGLVSRGPAGARSATSRAYYGAYHLAASLLDDFQCSCPRVGRNHDLLPKLLASASHGDAKRAAGLLDDLHGERVRADYHMQRTDSEDQNVAKMSVETAAKIQSLLNSFRADCSTPSVAQDLQNGVASVKRANGIPV